MKMNAPPTAHGKKSKANSSGRQVRLLAFGLAVTGTVLLAAKFYFVSELLTILGALAVLFVVGTAGFLLLAVIQEIAKWAALRLDPTKNAIVNARSTPISAEFTSFTAALCRRKIRDVETLQ